MLIIVVDQCTIFAGKSDINQLLLVLSPKCFMSSLAHNSPSSLIAILKVCKRSNIIAYHLILFQRSDEKRYLIAKKSQLSRACELTMMVPITKYCKGE